MGFCFQVRHKQPEDVPFKKPMTETKIAHVKYQRTAHLTAIVIIICMSSLYYGTCLSMISAINRKILTAKFGEWSGEEGTEGILIGFFFIGGAFGAVSAKFIAELITRRQMLFMLSCLGIVLTGLLQIRHVVCLVIMRVMQGFVVGASMAIVPMYIKEITPLDLHGSEGVLSQIFIVIGVVLDYILKVAFTAPSADYEFHWRFVFAFSGIPCVIQVIVFLTGFVPESPMSLIQRGQIEKAKEILGLFNIPEVLDEVLAEMIRESKSKQLKQIAKTHGITHEHSKQEREKAHKKKFQAGLPGNEKISLDSSHEVLTEEELNEDSKTQKVLQNIMTMYMEVPEIKPEVHRILSEHHMNFEPVPHVEKKWPLKGILLGFELHFMQQFSGMKMIVTQASALFLEYNQTLTLYAPLIANGAQLVATVLSIFVLNRFGRKLPLLAGNFWLSIINLILAALFLSEFIKGHDDGIIYGAFAMVILFEVVYSFSIGPIVWPYVPEIMPKKYVPLASSMNWTAAAISVIANPYVTKAVGSPYPVFFFFFGVMFIFFIINKKYLIETKGLTPTEIAVQLGKN